MKLLFKIDENTPFILKKTIEALGDHQVESVFHQGLRGISDQDLIAHCFKEKRILITLDHDFMNIILYPKEKLAGIIILCPTTQGKNAVNDLFKKFITKYSLIEALGKVIIVYPTEIKIR